MQNVPKIVPERLKAATSAVDHPDADVLTAFTERSLAGDERAVVLEHLARCGDCRDIVALSLPATEPMEAAVKPPATAWLAWPVLRWGLVAAGVVAIASVGIVQYQRRVRPETTAAKSSARFEVAANEAKNQSLPPVVPSGSGPKTDKIQALPMAALTDSFGAPSATFDENKSTVRAEASRTPGVPPSVGFGRGASLAIGGRLAHGPRMANQWPQQNAVQNQAPAPPSPFAKQQAAGDLSANMQVNAVSETVAVESQTTQLGAQTQAVDGRQTEAREIKDQPAAAQPAGEDYSSVRVDKAKPAESAQTANGAAAMRATLQSSQPFASPVLAWSAPAPRWTINSAGGLKRSFDQGNTWQDVDVDANPASIAATSFEIAGKTSRAKRKDGEKVAQKLAPAFRAVAATGPEVWAGGSSGLLYHSLDAGDHWTRVVPASVGAMLTGDIVGLEFPDLQHAKVSTSTAEIWTTSDDGQTWQKQ
jgi:hypothetical protein